jgi:outer membrane receptor protein involved in Fe transport
VNLRFAYGGTVARPLLREMSPFQNNDYVRRRIITGNPDLERTYVHNFDVRAEWFPTALEVLAASVFAKSFRNPIESVFTTSQGDLTFQNIPSAQNYGVELEARTTLGRLSEALDSFAIGVNVAFIASEVTLTDEQATRATSKRRPLAGQSPYVANLSLGYSPEDTGLSLNAFYNVFGPRIQDVGASDLPDVYEQPFHALDLTASYELGENWTLGATVTNLLLQSRRVTAGGFDWSVIDEGMGFGLRLGLEN